ncbi:hypothetical protein H0H81_009566 [Sphagnurus paluster]|uniref:Velvet domain-containing protein n=1 Tax=Sphagnurus paluster TaxID=117069 RepID=A0A9P7GQB9_9AGAR|nr:hypothetical protein H0H81_009566 [Sphagnurus paluster]
MYSNTSYYAPSGTSTDTVPAPAPAPESNSAQLPCGIVRPFSGQNIRFQLEELQKAEVGHRYARVDRRPLDPPPVVILRIFRALDIGTDQERNEEVEDYG